MDRELCCQVCGAINQAGTTCCFACGRSLKATRPLPTLTDAELLHESLLLGRYRVQEQVGTGGFSAVYQAVDTSTQRPVAIKTVSLHGLRAQEKIEALDTFHREVQFLTLLQHRNLPRIHSSFSEADCWYIVMDFIEGISLEHYLEQTASHMPLSEVLDLGLVLCDVLHYLHTRTPPIIFRDLKPSNIMLTPGGRLYVIDFGIARRFLPHRKKDTQPFGSPGYAAPEQYGSTQTTPRSDVYSLGAVLHHVLTNKHPASSPFLFAPIRESRPAAPKELEELIATMVERDATRRPQCIAEVKEQLQVIVEQCGVKSGLAAVAANRSHPAAAPVSLLPTSGSPASLPPTGGQAVATRAKQQMQQLVYYLPGNRLPPGYFRSLRHLWMYSWINFVCNALSFCMILGIALIVLPTNGLAGLTNPYFPIPFFLLYSLFNPWAVPLLNLIGLFSACLGVRQARKVHRFVGSNIGRSAGQAKFINSCGLVMGIIVLAAWVLFLLFFLIVMIGLFVSH
ncbi:MAG TPA: serine/threonine-protein kinase [Ktedonobacteraceae bacterium]